MIIIYVLSVGTYTISNSQGMWGDTSIAGGTRWNDKEYGGSHDLSGNFAVDRMVSKIMESYYFARIRRYVWYDIKCCPEYYMLNKVLKERQRGELHLIPPGKRLFEIIHLYHIGPFIKSTSGNNHILVL